MTLGATEIKELWDEFRIAKCQPNMTELMMRMHRVVDESDLLPEFNQVAGYDGIPNPGSSYWVETFNPPAWFVRSLADDKVVQDPERAEEEIEIPRFYHKKKKRRR